MLSAILIFKGQTFNHRIGLDHEGDVIENRVYPPPPDPDMIYKFINQEVKIKDYEMIVVLRAQATEDVRIFHRIVACYKLIEDTYKQKISKTIFFIEDLIKFDNKGRFKDFGLIKKIIKSVPHSYQIFHCEKMNDVPYFDWFVADQVFHVFGAKTLSVDDKFDKKICCLNNRFDERRYVISSWLASKDDAIDCSQHYSLSLDEVEKFSLIPDKHRSSVISGAKILGNVKSDKDHRISSFEGAKVLLDTNKIPNQHFPIHPPLDWISESAVDQLMARTKSAFCSIVTESRYDSPWPNFSEKTLRVIASGRPFILLAPPKTLQLLKDLDIKTFSDFWDEEYDSVENPTERMEMVMDQTDRILNHMDHRQVFDAMMPILEHNQTALKNIPRKMFEIS